MLAQITADPTWHAGHRQQELRESCIAPMGLQDHSEVVPLTPDPPRERRALQERGFDDPLPAGQNTIDVRIPGYDGRRIVRDEHVKRRVGKRPTERTDRGRGQQEIADVVQIDDQDPMQGITHALRMPCRQAIG